MFFLSCILILCSIDFRCCSSNGKEKDYESGFHYYGARYYWSEVLTGWLSVDPLSDKYPSISPYAYCVWNPIKLIDPDGRDTAFAGAAERALYLNYREKVFSDDKYKQVSAYVTMNNEIISEARLSLFAPLPTTLKENS